MYKMFSPSEHCEKVNDSVPSQGEKEKDQVSLPSEGERRDEKGEFVLCFYIHMHVHFFFLLVC